MAERIGAEQERLEEGLELIGYGDCILASVSRAADRLSNALGTVRERDPQDDVVAGALGVSGECHWLLVGEVEPDGLDRSDLEVTPGFRGLPPVSRRPP